MSNGYENIDDRPDPLVGQCFESPVSSAARYADACEKSSSGANAPDNSSDDTDSMGRLGKLGDEWGHMLVPKPNVVIDSSGSGGANDDVRVVNQWGKGWGNGGILSGDGSTGYVTRDGKSGELPSPAGESVGGHTVITRDSQYVPADEVDQLLILADRIKAAESDLKTLKAQYDELESFIVEQWAAIGKQSESRRGKTIYRKREFQCSTKADHGDALKEAVNSNGLPQFVKASVVIASLKSWIRERVQYTECGDLDLSQVPTDIVENLNVHERFVVGIRNS